MYVQYPGLTKAESNKFYQIIMDNTNAAPVPTAMDILYATAYTDLQGITTTPGQDAFNALLAEIKKLGSKGTLAALQAWVKSTFKTNDIYKTYPGITSAVVNEYYGVVQMTPPPPPSGYILQDALTAAKSWLQGLTPGSPEYNLAEELVNQINAEIGIPGDTIVTLQKWLASTFTNATDDIYMQYPGISQGDANKFYQIIMDNTNAAPAPTAMDNAYAAAYQYEQSNIAQPTQNAFNDLLEEMKTLGSKGTAAALQAWVKTKFATNDIFWTYPDIAQTAVNEFYKLLGLAPLTPTTIDTLYSDAGGWASTLTGANVALGQDLINEIKAVVSKGGTVAAELTAIQTWGKAVIAGTSPDSKDYQAASVAAKGGFEYFINSIQP